MQHEHHINLTNPLLELLLMSWGVVEITLENPKLLIIIGDRSSDKTIQIIIQQKK